MEYYIAFFVVLLDSKFSKMALKVTLGSISAHTQPAGSLPEQQLVLEPNVTLTSAINKIYKPSNPTVYVAPCVASLRPRLYGEKLSRMQGPIAYRSYPAGRALQNLVNGNIHEKRKVGAARRVARLAGPPFCDGTVGLRSSRPKVTSPELVSPETRDMSPEIFIQVARNFILLSKSLYDFSYRHSHLPPSWANLSPQYKHFGSPSRAYVRVKPESHARLTDC